MLRRRSLAATVTAAALAAGPAGRARAQDYPARPVRIVVPFAPGGSLDILARALAPGLGARLDQSVVVENRSGAGGNIGTELVARARPDGYTLMITSEPLAINPSLYRNPGYDPVRDFAPVALLALMSQAVITGPDSRPRSLEELAAMRGAAGRPLTLASAGVGSTGHMVAAMLALAGVPVTHVPYRGGGPATAAVIAGEVDVGVQSLPAALGFIRNGSVRAIAVSSTRRSSFLPEVPSLHEALPTVVADSWQAAFAPAGTPQPVLDRLEAEFLAVLAAPEGRATLERQGFEPGATGARGLGALIQAEVGKWPGVVRSTGAQFD